MTLCRSAAMLVSLVLVPLTVTAAPPPEPMVEYSADSTMQTEGGMTMKSRVYHTPTKQRMEMGGADGSVTIIRKDRKVVWQVMGDMYMEMPLDQSNAPDMGGFDIQEQTEVGEETINGLKTTKTKIIATKPDGAKFGGFFWTTKEGVTVKMDLLSKDGDKKMRMASELTNVKIEKQNPALFEVPAGATKNDMGAMMGGGMPNMDDMMKNAGQERAREKRPSRSSSESKSQDSETPAGEVNKMLKGLFGR
ncbi:MAG: hypothetical protein AABZ34_04190 [Nitrospirota bacterium]